jgi:hypothetical protein
VPGIRTGYPTNTIHSIGGRSVCSAYNTVSVSEVIRRRRRSIVIMNDIQDRFERWLEADQKATVDQSYRKSTSCRKSNTVRLEFSSGTLLFEKVPRQTVPVLWIQRAIHVMKANRYNMQSGDSWCRAVEFLSLPVKNMPQFRNYRLILSSWSYWIPKFGFWIKTLMYRTM